MKLELATALTDVHLDFDSLFNAVIVLKTDFTVVDANNTASLMFNTSARRLKDKYLFDVIVFEEPGIDEPQDLLGNVNAGYFSAKLKGPKGDRIHAFVQLVSTPSNPDVLILLLYDEAVENELARKYKEEIAQKDLAIEKLNESQAQLRENLSNLKFIAFAFTYTVNGFVSLALKYSVVTIPPLINVGSRLCIAGLILLGYFVGLKGRRISWSAIPGITANAVFGRALGLTAMAFACKYLTSGIISVFYGSVPVALALWTFVLKRKLPPRNESIGLAVGLAGLLFLGLHQATQISLLGVGLATASLLLLSLGLFFSSQQKEPLVALATEQTLGGVILLTVAFFVQEPFEFSAVTDASIAAYMFSLIFGMIAMQPAGRWLLQVSTPAQGSSFYYATPVIGMLAGALFAKEKVSVTDAIATSIVIVAIVLIFKDRKPKQP